MRVFTILSMRLWVQKKKISLMSWKYFEDNEFNWRGGLSYNFLMHRWVIKIRNLAVFKYFANFEKSKAVSDVVLIRSWACMRNLSSLVATQNNSLHHNLTFLKSSVSLVLIICVALYFEYFIIKFKLLFQKYYYYEIAINSKYLLCWDNEQSC